MGGQDLASKTGACAGCDEALFSWEGSALAVVAVATMTPRLRRARLQSALGAQHSCH